MENKQAITINFDFDSCDIYFNKKVYDNIKNLNFVKCCDMLKLLSGSDKIDQSNDCKEFEKLLKKEYWTMDNCIMVMDVINTNSVELFKYILQYIKFNVEGLDSILIYCCCHRLFNIYDYYSRYVLNNINDIPYVVFSILGGSLKLFNKCNIKKLNLPEIINAACLNGNLDNIKYLLGHGCVLATDSFKNAVKSENIKSMEWLLKNGGILTGQEYIEAIILNNFEVIKWLYNNNCPFVNSSDLESNIIHNGTIEIFDYFVENMNGYPSNYNYSLETAAKNYDIKFMHHIFTYKFKFYDGTHLYKHFISMRFYLINIIKVLLTYNYPYDVKKLTHDENLIIDNLKEEVDLERIQLYVKKYNEKYDKYIKLD